MTIEEINIKLQELREEYPTSRRKLYIMAKAKLLKSIKKDLEEKSGENPK